MDVFHFPGDKLSSCKIARSTMQHKDPSRIICLPPHNMTIEQQDLALEVVKDLEKGIWLKSLKCPLISLYHSCW